MNQVLIPKLRGLVDRAVLTEEQAAIVQTELGLGLETAVATSRRAVISEAITYIGGAVVIVSAGLLLANTWEALGSYGRPAVLAAAAVVLGIAAFLLYRTVRTDERRRLASTLWVGTAALAGFAIGLLLNELIAPQPDPNIEVYVRPDYWVIPLCLVVAFVCASSIAFLGYRLAPSAFGLLGISTALGGTLLTMGMLVQWSIDHKEEAPTLGFILLLVGSLIWLWFAQRDRFVHRYVAVVIGLYGSIMGAEGLRGERIWESLAATVLVAGGIAYLLAYLRLREWPYLAAGIAAMIMGGIELLTRYVTGTTGALASMALGIVLLVVGLRLFRERVEHK